MSNQDEIFKNFTESNPFKYEDVIKTAKKVLTATASGLDYASLKFLQHYCEYAGNEERNVVSPFFDGDPRRYAHLGEVRSTWKFNVKSKPTNRVKPQKHKSKIIQNDKSNQPIEVKETYLNDPNVRDFVTHFRGLLTDQPFVHAHSGTAWRCTSLKGALDSYSWPRGKHAKNFKETNAILKELAQELECAINKKNEKKALRACIGILEWGGVRNGAHGVVKIYLEDTPHREHPLIESISGAVKVLTADQVDLTNFSSSKRLESDENESIQLDQSDMIVEPGGVRNFV